MNYPVLLVVTAAFSFCQPSVQFILRRCDSALGMESGKIPDSSLSASSSFDPARVGPLSSRLNVEVEGGAWCPGSAISPGIVEYLQVNLTRPHWVSAVSVQGRFGNGQGVEFADNFSLQYWRPGLTSWRNYRQWNGSQVLTGNTNNYLPVKRKLMPPLFATSVRVVPYSLYGRTVCMRVELHGCNKTDGLVSYSTALGQRRPPEVELTDMTYDGYTDLGRQYGGVGQLTDGVRGADNFRQNNGHGRGFEWVGWSNTSLGSNVLDMVFEFDEVRNFSSVDLHVNNDRIREVKVFSVARACGSVGGRYYNSPVISHYTMGSDIFNEARTITVQLSSLLAKYINLKLKFSDRWMLISEITFHSVLATGNYTEELGPLTNVTKHQPPRNINHIDSVFLPGEYIGLIGVLCCAVLLLLAAGGLYLVRRVRAQKSSQMVVSRLASPYDDGKQPFTKMAVCDPFPDTTYRLSPFTAVSEKHATSINQHPYTDYNGADYAEPLMSTAGGTSLSDSCPSQRRVLLQCVPIGSGTPAHRHQGSPAHRRTFNSSGACSPRPSPRRLVHQQPSPALEQHYAATDICHPVEMVARCGEDVHVTEYPRHALRFVEKLGEGDFGEVHLCSTEFDSERGCDVIPDVVGSKSTSSLVAVKTLRPGVSDAVRDEFQREMRTLSGLRDENIVCVLGVCSRQDPLMLVVEYPQHGDLNQYLQSHVAETAANTTNAARVLSYGSLVYMAAQIASGMKYLESLNFVHRDLATRNCLVGGGHVVKVADFGVRRPAYLGDYYRLDEGTLLPVRWMACESVILGRFSSRSDVWSFAVTLWEILTYARQQPYEDLSDDAVIDNLVNMHHRNGEQVYLPRPHDCSKEIYDLMLECWRPNDEDRPNFREIHLFLQRKNLGYRTDISS